MDPPIEEPHLLSIAPIPMTSMVIFHVKTQSTCMHGFEGEETRERNDHIHVLLD
jgi:hypothetical protein